MPSGKNPGAGAGARQPVRMVPRKEISNRRTARIYPKEPQMELPRKGAKGAENSLTTDGHGSSRIPIVARNKFAPVLKNHGRAGGGIEVVTTRIFPSSVRTADSASPALLTPPTAISSERLPVLRIPVRAGVKRLPESHKEVD